MRSLRKLGALALCTAFIALPAQAFVWTESDAGQLLGTAEVTTGVFPLTQIDGRLDFDLDLSVWDVDLFKISIFDPAAFRAATVAGAPNMNDPALYLFDSAGNGVYMNNDNTTTDFESTLPSGHVSGPVSAGLFYLAIAWGFSDPLDSSSGSIFSLEQFLDPTGIYGPTGPGGGGALDSWNVAGPIDFDRPLNYQISLTGAISAVPEPGTLALLLVAAAGAFARRRRLH